MSKILLFHNLKGGAGATSISLFTAYALTHEKAANVLWLQVSDIPDAQAWLGNCDDSFAQLLAIAERGSITQKMYHKLLQNNDAIMTGVAPVFFWRNISEGKKAAFNKILDDLQEQFDYIIIDTDFQSSREYQFFGNYDEYIVVNADPASMKVVENLQASGYAWHDKKVVLNQLPKSKRYKKRIANFLQDFSIDSFYAIQQDARSLYRYLIFKDAWMRIRDKKFAKSIRAFIHHLD